MSITKEEIALLEIEEFPGSIYVIQNEKEIEKAINHLSRHTLIGFDTETRPAYKKGTAHAAALIQLAIDESCYLFRINKTGFTQPLIDFLSNPMIKKIGLSIKDDFITMRRRAKFTPSGFEELQEIVPKYGITDTSLQKVYALLFNKKISKNQRLSNWEADTLTESQKKYAALDAWACLRIYKKLMNCQFPSQLNGKNNLRND